MNFVLTIFVLNTNKVMHCNRVRADEIKQFFGPTAIVEPVKDFDASIRILDVDNKIHAELRPVFIMKHILESLEEDCFLEFE